jgi:ADP-ribosylation factor-binding protein GGA
VKKRCIELLYSWYKGLPHETKIGEAYKMLKAQHIIKEDPTYMDKVSSSSYIQNHTASTDTIAF